MKPSITVQRIKPADFADWSAMALILWPDYEKEALEADLRKILNSSNQTTFLAKNEHQASIGFINASIRTDYVEGSDGSPTGYIEGIYVEPAYRRKGVAKALLKMGEAWMIQQGCTQVGSDAWEHNTASRLFHKNLGFSETEPVIHFIKNLKSN